MSAHNHPPETPNLFETILRVAVVAVLVGAGPGRQQARQRPGAAQRTHSAAASGPGAFFARGGNKAVGAGRLAIRQARAPPPVLIKLQFMRPYKGHNTASFNLAASAGSSKPGTTVTWLMQGLTPLVAKLMQVFVSVASLIGKDFGAGITKRRQVAER